MPICIFLNVFGFTYVWLHMNLYVCKWRPEVIVQQNSTLFNEAEYINQSQSLLLQGITLSLFLKVGTTGGLSCPASICMDDGDLNSHLQIYEANTLTTESCPQF